MNKELYEKLFARMDELGAIRKHKETRCNGPSMKKFWTEVKSEEPILSDCINAYKVKFGNISWHSMFEEEWIIVNPYLSQQSDDFGNRFLHIII